MFANWLSFRRVGYFCDVRDVEVWVDKCIGNVTEEDDHGRHTQAGHTGCHDPQDYQEPLLAARVPELRESINKNKSYNQHDVESSKAQNNVRCYKKNQQTHKYWYLRLS